MYVSPQEARDLVDGGKGKIVEPLPQEIVDLNKATKGEAKTELRGEHGPELPASKAPAKLRAPQAKTEKPSDG